MLKFKKGDAVYWKDPDEGIASGYGEVVYVEYLDDEVTGDEIISLKMVDDGEVEALAHELVEHRAYRLHQCENKHRWQSEVKFGATTNLSGEASAYCPTCGKKAQSSSPHVNWLNPWADCIIPVDLDSLAEVYNKYVEDNGGMGDFETKKKIPNWDCRKSWTYYAPKEKLDAYVLPDQGGYFSFGVRHSNEPSAYYSMMLPSALMKDIKPLWAI